MCGEAGSPPRLRIGTPSMTMNGIQIVSLLTAVLGAALGTAGFTISILAFLRDRPRMTVVLDWDLESAERPGFRVGMVSVTNIGRRAVYVGAVALELPKHSDYKALLLKGSIPGKRFGEGDPPAKYVVTYDKLEKYKAEWYRIRAFAEDSTGKKYYSEFTRIKPSWADKRWHSASSYRAPEKQLPQLPPG